MNKYTLSIKDLSSKEMQYNTQQKRMPLPEYGRSIQNMVHYQYNGEYVSPPA